MIWRLRSALLTKTVGSHTNSVGRWSARDLVTLAQELRCLAVEARKNIFACHEGDDVMVANPVTSFWGNAELYWEHVHVANCAVVAPLGRTERTSATMFPMWPPATVPSGYTNGPLMLVNEKMVCQMEDGG